MTTPIDPYKVLQVDPEAESEVIVAAYRRLARKYHPDVATGPDPAARMAAINAAWDLIGEPAARAAFDRGRGFGTNFGQRAGDAWSRATDSDPSTSTTTGPPPSGSTGSSAEAQPAGSASSGHRPEPEMVSRDWTSGRSSVGGGYDPSMRTADGQGAAGPPPGNPAGSILNFGRFAGWSLGEIARTDLGYLEWLDRMPIGRSYRDEIDAILRRTGRRRAAEQEATERRGLFRRR